MTSHILCSSEELVDGQARRFDVDDHHIALVRIGDSYHAVGDRCSHANDSSADGQVWSEDCALECPKHYSKFNLLTGSPDTFPATQPVPIYETKIESGQLKIVI